MLKNVNLLYLGCSVLCLIDISYLSRFWTQFEAWLSMQAADSTGLHPAPKGRQRHTFKCIHNATKGNEDEKLRQMWATRKPAEAKELLAMPDVTVTNASDKETQLVKIAKLDEEAQAVFTVEYAGQLKAAGVAAAKLLEGGFAPGTAQGGRVHAGGGARWWLVGGQGGGGGGGCCRVALPRRRWRRLGSSRGACRHA